MLFYLLLYLLLGKAKTVHYIYLLRRSCVPNIVYIMYTKNEIFTN